MSAQHFRNSYPALTGETVQQGHADACAEFGHAKHTVGGVEQPRCPRCGEIRTLESQFVTVEREHAVCEGCDRAVVHACIDARVTGSVGATAIFDGRALNEPYYHSARVARRSTYDAEMREREAIEADVVNERDGYKG